MPDRDEQRRVGISGASGLIGSALSAFLRARGDQVVHLVRRKPLTELEIGWDPSSRTLDPADLSGLTAVVHLAGAGVGAHRWTPAYKHEIRASRVEGTATIAAALADLGEPIALVSGSAIGFYGDRGERTLTEDSEPGHGFLAEVVRDWEAATKPAQDAGLRVVHARTGLVLTPKGGAMERVLLLARWGLAGPLGSGHQEGSGIKADVQGRALAHLCGRERARRVHRAGGTPWGGEQRARKVGVAARGRARVPTNGTAARRRDTPTRPRPPAASTWCRA